MKPFEEKKFNIGELKGISAKTIEEHLKLYAGYVKNANLISEKLGEMYKDGMDKHSYEASEIVRRFSFEYNGIRNHEIYFDSLSDGAVQLSDDSPLKKKIEETQGSFDIWLSIFKQLAMTRGIGWAVLWYDRKEDRLLNTWVDEQHLGQLQGCDPLLALDMWEHSFVADYQPSGKKQYIEDFFANLNWSKVEENFKNAR
ncbi:MAG: Fe-Mn family superoxide dismutase [Nitrospira sp.]